MEATEMEAAEMEATEVNRRTSRLRTAMVLALIGLILAPVVVNAQCSVIGSTGFTTASIFRGKTLNTNANCALTMSMNVVNCIPGTMGSFTSLLSAFASLAAASPSCAWQCVCGTATIPVTIDGSDGLPVELMDFSIEG